MTRVLKMHKLYRSSGFTLLEVLIALFIFAIMATVATISLQRIFANKAALDEHIQKMNTLQMAITLFKQDTSQAIDRPVRDNSGLMEIALQGSPQQIAFTRIGNMNPLGYYTISHLQRIAYSCNSSLQRTSWKVLDRAPDTTAQSRKLIDNIQDCSFSYIDKKMKRHTSWPDNDKKTTDTTDPLPIAVEVQFNYQQRGELTVLVPIYAGNLHPEESDEKIPS